MTNDLPRGTSQTSQTSVSVSDIDYTGWLTKAEAATAIGVTTKTVERLAADGKIQQGATQRQGRGPRVAVYHPDDVQRIAQERRQAPAPFVLPAGVTSPVNGNGHGTDSNRGQPPAALAIVPPGEDLFRALVTAAVHVMSETRSETPALFLTIPEAAAVSGLSETCLRKLISAEKLPAIRDRGWKIRRRDLEAV